MRSGLAGQWQVLGVSPEVTSIPAVGPSQADWDRAEGLGVGSWGPLGGSWGPWADAGVSR